jgi:hypothetical protein
MTTSTAIADPETIRKRMGACRAELAALRRLLRISLAIREVEQARRTREQLAGGQEVRRA